MHACVRVHVCACVYWLQLGGGHSSVFSVGLEDRVSHALANFEAHSLGLFNVFACVYVACVHVVIVCQSQRVYTYVCTGIIRIYIYIIYIIYTCICMHDPPDI